MTVGEFVEKYSDKYEITQTDPHGSSEDFINYDPECNISNLSGTRLRIKNKSDDKIIFFSWVESFEMKSLKDCLIGKLDCYIGEDGNNIVWYPGGIPQNSSELTKTDYYKMFEQVGIVSSSETDEFENTYREQDTGTIVVARATKENLNGICPGYIYQIIEKYGKITFNTKKVFIEDNVEKELDMAAISGDIKVIN